MAKNKEPDKLDKLITELTKDGPGLAPGASHLPPDDAVYLSIAIFRTATCPSLSSNTKYRPLAA